jgi:LPXTG-site transpeptidase (sortase) family protein
MSKIQMGWKKYSKGAARLSIVILVVLLVFGLIIVPLAGSSAQMIEQEAFNYHLPLVLNNSDFGSMESSTPSPSATLTGTQPTITKTSTVGPSPTQTYTPSPTFTGTLQPNAVITISVAGSPANVNQNLDFTIKITNIGTGPTHNNIVSDSYPTYLDVLTVTSTQGSIVKQTHSFTVSVGDVNPGVVITIIATVRVNSTISRTETTTNTVALIYNDAFNNTAQKTAGVSYTVVVPSTLPGTGELPLNWREAGVNPAAMIPGALLMVIGAILLVLVVLWSKARSQPNKLWMAVAGAILFLVGFVIAITASSVFSPNMLVQVTNQTPIAGGILAHGQPVPPSATILPHLPASAFSTPDNVVPLVTLPDYPVPTPVLTVTPKPGETGPDTSDVTRIVIPILNLDTEVKYVPYDGMTWLISGLRQEVAWMGNTSWPGLGSNTALAGHVTVAGMGDGPFRHLDELPQGELVLVYTEQNLYTYQVRDSKVTDGGDISVTLPTDNPQISLITCVDWDQDSHTYLNRLVVVADLVRTEPLAMGSIP